MKPCFQSLICLFSGKIGKRKRTVKPELIFRAVCKKVTQLRPCGNNRVMNGEVGLHFLAYKRGDNMETMMDFLKDSSINYTIAINGMS